MTKSRLYIYLIAGGYIVHTGIGLAKSALEERPENYLLYLAVGVLFTIIGAIFAVKSILRLSKGGYGAPSDFHGESDEKEDKGGTDNEDRNGI